MSEATTNIIAQSTPAVRMNIKRTRNITNPTYYVSAIRDEYSEHAFDEERAELFRGLWREKVYAVAADHPLDLEIGTGNGYFFAHRALNSPERCLLGIELKFKPLIQSIRRALKGGARNARIARFHGNFLNHLFMPGELNHVFIHHPDPWTNPRKIQRRLLSEDFLKDLAGLQQRGSFLDFKTDSSEYFFWAVKNIKNSSYKIERYTEDLHRSELSGENFTTQFEQLFMAKGHSIFYLRAYI